MEALEQTLRERVEELTGSGRSRLSPLSTMGTQAAIGELIARSDRLEKAIREIALEVEKLAALQQVDASPHEVVPASDR